MAIVYAIVHYWVRPEEIQTILSLAIRALAFGALMAGLSYWSDKLQKKPLDLVIDIPEDETILSESTAVHINEKGRIVGKLCLTDKRMIFKSRKVSGNEISVGLKSITKTYRHNYLGIVHRGFVVETGEDATESFILQYPERWVEQINEARLV